MSIFTVSIRIEAFLHLLGEHSHTPISVVDATREICTKFSCGSVCECFGGNEICLRVNRELLECMVYLLVTVGKWWNSSKMLSGIRVFSGVRQLHLKSIVTDFLGVETMSHVDAHSSQF